MTKYLVLVEETKENQKPITRSETFLFLGGILFVLTLIGFMTLMTYAWSNFPPYENRNYPETFVIGLSSVALFSSIVFTVLYLNERIKEHAQKRDSADESQTENSSAPAK